LHHTKLVPGRVSADRKGHRSSYRPQPPCSAEQHPGVQQIDANRKINRPIRRCTTQTINWQLAEASPCAASGAAQQTLIKELRRQMG
jgi:hypothetical protein